MENQRNQNEANVPFQYKELLESSPYPIFAVDRAYRYLSFNRAHAAVMKALYRNGSLLSQYYKILSDFNVTKINLDRALSGETIRASTRVGLEKNNNATLKWIIFQSLPNRVRSRVSQFSPLTLLNA